MSDQTPSPPPKSAGFLTRLSTPLLALIGLLVVLGVAGGGFYAYRTYDYVQHDNDFCMSCHLMAEPYALFAQSAHRGLSCKACHQPNLVDRSTMALTQIVENPEAIGVHAEVPNERCAECHIEGDPDKWRMIANSAGHRVHLESEDPALEGLRCVECHATSVHEFAPVDRTCGQSGCHEDNVIRLGEMGSLTIHCAACHSFVAPVEGGGREDVDVAILAGREECLSCHAMRARVHFPEDDPHDGRCASCHNPHTQARPDEADESCADSGCHSSPAELTKFHKGLRPGILEDCLYCHQAHGFEADGGDCLGCHVGIGADSLAVPRREHREGMAGGAQGIALLDFAGTLGVGVGWWAHPAQQAPTFQHSAHRSVGCENCHDSTEEHGGLTVRTLQDCRSCHHDGGVPGPCTRCHGSEDLPVDTFPVVRSMGLSVGAVDARTFAFRHEPHQVFDCTMCHEQGLDRPAESADCSVCHVIHHEPDNDCASCHRAAPISAHPPAQAHVTCTGAGCHTSTPFEGVPRTRSTCLACHQDRREHQPDRRCADCHQMPGARGGEDHP